MTARSHRGEVATRGRRFTVWGDCLIGRRFGCARAEGVRATLVLIAAPIVFGTLDTNTNRARSRGQAEIHLDMYSSKRAFPLTFPL